MLEFACPQCSASIKAGDDQVGEPINCPKCNQTVTVPGSTGPQSKSPDGEWSVFDDDERFIEESVAKPPAAKYRTRDDDREVVVDDDEAAARQEVEEEKAAVADVLARHKAAELGTGGGSSNMTVEEKMAADDQFAADQKALPESARLRSTGWKRDQQEPVESIRLEGQPEMAHSISVKCHVCDSVMLVGENKLGKQVSCSECGSTVSVPESSPEKRGPQTGKGKDGAKKTDSETGKKQTTKLVDDLFEEPVEPDADDYGLAPAPDDLLKPVVPLSEENLVEPKDDYLTPVSAMAENSISGPDEEDRSSLETSELFEEMQAEKSVRFERLPWREHIFGVLKDPGFLLRVVLSTLVMLIGYTIFYAGWSMATTAPVNRGAEFAGNLIMIFAYPFIPAGFLTVCWVGQKVLNSTIVGDKKMPEMETLSVVEWLSNCLFVAVGLALCGFPGFVLGSLVWTMFTEWQGFWIIPCLTSMTAMALSPLVILSAMHNRSPFKIQSQRIAESIKSKSDAWIEFYLPALVLALVTGCLWLLAMTESWIVASLMFLAVNIGYGLFFRMMGRLMGTIVANKKKKSESSPTDDQ